MWPNGNPGEVEEGKQDWKLAPKRFREELRTGVENRFWAGAKSWVASALPPLPGHENKARPIFSR